MLGYEFFIDLKLIKYKLIFININKIYNYAFCIFNIYVTKNNMF
ncbi:conserved hypothetical protein [Rickettsia prowazekii str. Rp22]|uniref:Uncharacterized protein n=1 Tax=Rickettsia prowazekii (strain Rp22) TaxID=449216 RepID=D5AWZ4_RICPP|nr:conserved hypothetical protein [Rickettsia prowazekii str. Rp22]